MTKYHNIVLISALVAITAMLAGCGDEKATQAKHDTDVRFGQEALCACLKTKTWLGECLQHVTVCEDNTCVTNAELLHAPCLAQQTGPTPQSHNGQVKPSVQEVSI